MKDSLHGRPGNISCLAPVETAVGVVRHPRTGCWQVWISFTGCDLMLLTAQRQQRDAEADRQALKAVLGSMDYYDVGKIIALLQKLINTSDEEPQPFPAHLIVRIFQAIWHPSLSEAGEEKRHV